jgi:uncharacterized protein (DUF2461 family)
MKPTVNLKPALAFLDDLGRNNNKLWFDAHRAQYDQARGAFEEFVQLLIAEIGRFDDLGMLSAKDVFSESTAMYVFPKTSRRTKRTWAHT